MASNDEGQVSTESAEKEQNISNNGLVQSSEASADTSDETTEVVQPEEDSCSGETGETDKPVTDPDGDTPADAQTDNCDSSDSETVTFKVIFNKQKHDLTYPLDKTVLDLKGRIQTLTGVPPPMQKIMYKGLAKDESTLRDLKVTKGAKIMVVGSTMNDVLQVTNTPSAKELQEEEKAATSKEPLSQQKQHKKVLDKYGKPDDILPGIKNAKEPLPHVPLTGMYNKAGGKVRLTFKLELDQLWLGTKERTEKIPMNSIKAVVSEPIAGHEEYHMLAIQLGPTEASRYWIYWVPAQYVDAIKDTILGKWQLF